jgi:hypothetical protein
MVPTDSLPDAAFYWITSSGAAMTRSAKVRRTVARARDHNRPNLPSAENPNEIMASDDADRSDHVAGDFVEVDL